MQPTCTSARRLGDETCGLDALFKYTGALYAEYHGRKPRNDALMCIQCAYEILHDLGWQIKDRVVRLEPLTGMKYRIYCKVCFAQSVVSWAIPAAVPAGTFPGAFCFCPRCGAHAGFTYDPDLDYWETISAAMDNMPVPLLKMLFEEWPRNQYPAFADFVKHEFAAFDTGADLEIEAP